MQPPEAERPPQDGRHPGARARHILVVAGGDVPARSALDAAWPGWLDDVASVIAADSGWAHARALGLDADLLVGDLDSLDPASAAEAEAAAVPILRHPAAKDESDTELALGEAVRGGATRITVVGAVGGPRLDHALANVWLIAHPMLDAIDVVLLDERTRVSLLAAPDAGGRPVTRALPGRLNALVSLFPLGGDADGITTRGLRFPLADESLATGPTRGLSNVRVAADAAVTLRRGRLLIVEGLGAERGS
jgi:thiamine pyrophosphokinase